MFVKILSNIALFVIILSLLPGIKGQSGQNSSGQKRALLIGVFYEEEKVKSCQDEKNNILKNAPKCSWDILEPKADLDLLESTLTADTLGFKKENITRLETAAQTTHPAIISAIEKLISETQKG